MAKDTNETEAGREGVISIIGPGMRVVGDCDTEGTLRIEGSVDGTVRAGKAVVVGKDGVVDGDVATQDAVIGGHVTGSIVAESRLELQATCVIEGEIRARRIKLEEGGVVNGNVTTGEAATTGSSIAEVTSTATDLRSPGGEQEEEEEEEEEERRPPDAALGRS